MAAGRNLNTSVPVSSLDSLNGSESLGLAKLRTIHTKRRSLPFTSISDSLFVLPAVVYNCKFERDGK
jgi:hypothetical protein